MSEIPLLKEAQALATQEANRERAEARLTDAMAENQEMVAQLLPEVAANVKAIAATLTELLELVQDRRRAGFDE